VNQTSKRELELTGDLLEYAQATALLLAKKRCPKHVSPNDVAQEALLHLIARPPKYDATKGASEKTLLHTALACLVSKCLARERKQVDRFEAASQEPEDHRNKEPRETLTLDHILRFIDCPESRALCRCYVECDGNKSMVARRLKISEGTVRYRLHLLAPKLIAAGFKPEEYGGFR